MRYKLYYMDNDRQRRNVGKPLLYQAAHRERWRLAKLYNTDFYIEALR